MRNQDVEIVIIFKMGWLCSKDKELLVFLQRFSMILFRFPITSGNNISENTYFASKLNIVRRDLVFQFLRSIWASIHALHPLRSSASRQSINSFLLECSVAKRSTVWWNTQVCIIVFPYRKKVLSNVFRETLKKAYHGKSLLYFVRMIFILIDINLIKNSVIIHIILKVIGLSSKTRTFAEHHWTDSYRYYAYILLAYFN